MSPKQMTEILNLVNKEEILEMEGKVEKALGHAKMAAAHAAAAAVNVAIRADTKQALSIEQIPMEEVQLEKEKSQDKSQEEKIGDPERKKASGSQSGST